MAFDLLVAVGAAAGFAVPGGPAAASRHEWVALRLYPTDRTEGARQLLAAADMLRH